MDVACARFCFLVRLMYAVIVGTSVTCRQKRIGKMMHDLRVRVVLAGGYPSWPPKEDESPKVLALTSPKNSAHK